MSQWPTYSSYTTYININPNTQSCIVCIVVKNNKKTPQRIGLAFNEYYTSFLKEKETFNQEASEPPPFKPKLQQHQLTKWILMLHCTQQIQSEGIIGNDKT